MSPDGLENKSIKPEAIMWLQQLEENGWADTVRIEVEFTSSEIEAVYFDYPSELHCQDAGTNPPDCEDEPDDDDPHYPTNTPGSWDPNDIIGPAGFGEKQWTASNQKLPYMIRFENDPDLATAPAQTVIITQQLDSTLDARTFRLGEFGFGNMVFSVPANRSAYSGRLDVRDSVGVYVEVIAGIDIIANQVFWMFSSIDPTTGVAPTNPLIGFLAINDSLHHGEGFVTYTIRAKQGAKTGDVVNAQARIIFDVNDPIDTPAIFNTLDADLPVSRVQALPNKIDTPRVEINWSGTDDSTGAPQPRFTSPKRAAEKFMSIIV